MAVVITKQPVDVLAVYGDTVSFTVEATGAASYEWQYSDNSGTTWKRLTWEGYNTATLTGKMNTSRLAFLYRCELTDEEGHAVYTNVVRVHNVSGSFAYTGGVQTFTVPVSGVYRLTVVGANGAHSFYDTPHGGRSVGYRELKKGDVLYVCCGQAGAFDGKAAYNGGGAGIVPTGGNANWRNPSGSGGGATHIALVTGTLAEIGEGNKSKVLIVAGGGGGESGHSGSGAFGTYDSEGGSGGGNSGGKGGTNNGTFTPAVPGTQTSGYGFGQGQKATVSVVWDEDNLCAGAGGGGLWGGYAGTNHASGGAGGSGYIGGVPSIVYKGKTYAPSTENNYNTAGTNGYATIELVVKTTLPVIFNGTTLESIIFNGIEITGLIVDGTQLFFERLKRRIAAWFTSTKTALYWKALT